MRRSSRFVVVALTAGVGLAVAIASAAWACTYNMQGTVWFTGTAGGATVTSARSGATVYSQAANLYSKNAA